MPGLKLSVIIVNYNVKFFLEQCLHSVEKAMKGIAGEIFVVDNQSVDGSVAMVREKFPNVKLIENQKNLGFSKANNQGIRESEGEFILILNPDTVVEEDCFSKTLAYMDEHPKAGTLGVKMIDGKGHFLPESKRALPTPWVSFYKIFGLSRLFPKSRKYGQYHLGYLDKDSIHKVDVLPGAFMLLRKSALDKSGLLDETFFMYGEDIDLSYRIQKEGYTNIYFPETTIIHYKGESTRKSSINYVLVFYQAMIIFANKHFSSKNARMYNASIQAAIYFRMLISMLSRIINIVLYPLLDALVGFLGFLWINNVWEAVKFPEGGGHPPEFLWIFVPSYVVIGIISIYFSGGYDKPYQIWKLIRGLAFGTAVILVLYSLMPENYRFSRALILLGTGWAVGSYSLIRLCFHFLGWKTFSLKSSNTNKVAIVSRFDEFSRISNLLSETNLSVEIAGRIDPAGYSGQQGGFSLGHVEQLDQIVQINKLNEVIFSASDMNTQEIIHYMLMLTPYQVDYKIAPPKSPSIIGSNSINTAGDLYVIDISSIAKPANRRNKRLLDLVLAIFLLVTLPLGLFLYIKRAGRYIRNLFLVLLGFRTWIAYYPEATETPGLPSLKPGILLPFTDQYLPDPIKQAERNLDYARNYNLLKDIRFVWNNTPYLGSTHIGHY